jgi:hypothetical protein
MALPSPLARPEPGPPAQRKAVGWLGEVATDRAVLLGSGWRCMPHVPVYDTRHVDRAYAWDGIELPHFVQVKTAEGPSEDGFYRWRVPADTFIAYPRFSLVLLALDRITAQPYPCGWQLDSGLVEQVASRVHIPATGKTEYHLWGSVTGDDRLKPYRLPIEDLWRRLVPGELAPAPLVLPPAPMPLPEDRFPHQQSEEGAYFELLVIEEGLRTGNDRLMMYRPIVDVFGRDLLVQLVNRPQAIYLQIKGTGRIEDGRVNMWVPRETFAPRDDFWLAFLAYERDQRRRFPEFWLVPSVDFVRLASDHSPTALAFIAHLDPARDRWRQYRHPVDELGALLLQILNDG